MTTQVLWAVVLLSSGLLAGGVITVSLAVIPALRVFGERTDFQIHRVFNPLPDYYMPQSLFLSAFAVLGLLTFGGGTESPGRWFLLVGLGLSLPIILISLLGNRRINLLIRRWSQPELPPGYSRMRRVWDRWHISRTALCLVLAVCYGTAVGLKGGTPARMSTELLGALMAGGLLMIEVAVVPTFHRVPAPVSARLHLAVDHYIERSMPAFTVLTALAAVLTLATDGDSGTRRLLLVVGVVLTVVVAAVSHLCNRRLNVRLRQWELDPPPPTYAGLRKRWDRFHLLRTTSGLAAFACFVVACLPE
jgi:hypothetical protein